MSSVDTPSKTQQRRLALYRDRWSSHSLNPAIEEVAEKLTLKELRSIPLFAPYPDKFLDKISPDIAKVSWKENALLYEQGTYIDLAFYVLSGEVEVALKTPKSDRPKVAKAVEPDAPPEGTVILDLVALSKQRRSATEIVMLSSLDIDLPSDEGLKLGAGEIFGEIGALSGWPQSVTARTTGPCTLIQIRLPALRLMKNKSPEFKEHLDRVYRERSLFTQLKSNALLAGLDDDHLAILAEKVKLISLEPDQVLVKRGEPAQALYLVRSGFVKLEQSLGEGEVVVSYLSKGRTLGEVECLIRELQEWQVTASSVEYAELIEIPMTVLMEMTELDPSIESALWESAGERVKEAGFSRRNPGQAQLNRTALETGLVEGNSILIIDLAACTRCDDCVRACAATHDGRPRFVREGRKLDNLLIPKSCYHCHDPVCLVGCPTGAIHRMGQGDEIKIDDDICIGCSTCANNCPYDAIVMHETGEKWAEDMVPASLRGMPRKLASKCDLCAGSSQGPACVNNCPQGCAARVSSPAELQAWL